MDLIEIHRIVIQSRFPFHRVKYLNHYAVCVEPKELRHETRFFLTNLTQDELLSLDNIINKQISFIYEGFEITGKVNDIHYCSGTIYYFTLIDI